MREIPLTQGQVALVDDEDYEWLNQWKWWACESGKKSKNFYAVRKMKVSQNNYTRLRMHQVIMNVPEGYMADHIDGNTLNNQRSNLRIVTFRQNQQNRHVKKTSIYPGVSWVKKLQKWQAHIQINGKVVYLGIFNNEIDAFRAYYDEVLKTGEEVIGFSYPLASEGEKRTYSINRYPKPVMGINIINSDDVIYFESMSDAHRKGGFCIQAISRCCKGKAKTHRGYQWQLVNVEEGLNV